MAGNGSKPLPKFRCWIWVEIRRAFKKVGFYTPWNGMVGLFFYEAVPENATRIDSNGDEVLIEPEFLVATTSITDWDFAFNPHLTEGSADHLATPLSVPA